MVATSNSALPLTTSKTEQLCHIEEHLLSRCLLINNWFQAQWALSAPPVYGSVDLRNAGFKVAPVDMNLFPAGFNNLNPVFLSQSLAAARQAIQAISKEIKNILIIPESHTRNLLYFANIKTLQSLLEQAQFNVRFGWVGEAIDAPFEIQLESGDHLLLEPLIREANQIHLKDFTPDLILLNNDLSAGIPDILQNLDQFISPPTQLGWSQRLKSEYFKHYAQVAVEFAELVDIDPWLITPLFRHCGQIDFKQKEGMACLTDNATALFTEIKKKYEQYQIPHAPFLIVKADAGTYGMAVMTVRDPEELMTLNRKQRTHMSMTKGGQPVRKVMIQEGVYTFETVGEVQAVAEPVIYLWGSEAVGGFYRVHTGRGIDENLNSPGMQFEPLAFAQPCNEPHQELAPDACPNRYYTYGVVAKLGMLAAAREMKGQLKS
jgi:glutamate--cysteine ligase